MINVKHFFSGFYRIAISHLRAAGIAAVKKSDGTGGTMLDANGNVVGSGGTLTGGAIDRQGNAHMLEVFPVLVNKYLGLTPFHRRSGSRFNRQGPEGRQGSGIFSSPQANANWRRFIYCFHPVTSGLIRFDPV
jgi:hypothetical protein